MNGCLNNLSKRDHAINMVNRIAKTIPDIELVEAIRIYGPNVREYDYNVSLTHGAARHPSSSLHEKILTKTMSDTMFNPLANALEGAYHELKLIEGNTAIIIISD